MSHNLRLNATAEMMEDGTVTEWISRCLLCGSPGTALVRFEPTDEFAALAGVPKGYVLMYSLCDTCRERPDHIARAKAVFIEEDGPVQ